MGCVLKYSNKLTITPLIKVRFIVTVTILDVVITVSNRVFVLIYKYIVLCNDGNGVLAHFSVHIF